VSLQIGSLASNNSSPRVSVKRIVFTTVSHDQGFSGTLHLKGTYDHSNTWFDARVLTSSGRDRVPRRHIQANVHASFEFKTHVNRWDSEGGDAGLLEWLAAIQVSLSLRLSSLSLERQEISY
jgi:hypothetical protein